MNTEHNVEALAFRLAVARLANRGDDPAYLAALEQFDELSGPAKRRVVETLVNLVMMGTADTKVNIATGPLLTKDFLHTKLAMLLDSDA